MNHDVTALGDVEKRRQQHRGGLDSWVILESGAGIRAKDKAPGWAQGLPLDHRPRHARTHGRRQACLHESRHDCQCRDQNRQPPHPRICVLVPLAETASKAMKERHGAVVFMFRFWATFFQ